MCYRCDRTNAAVAGAETITQMNIASLMMLATKWGKKTKTKGDQQIEQTHAGVKRARKKRVDEDRHGYKQARTSEEAEVLIERPGARNESDDDLECDIQTRTNELIRQKDVLKMFKLLEDNENRKMDDSKLKEKYHQKIQNLPWNTDDFTFAFDVTCGCPIEYSKCDCLLGENLESLLKNITGKICNRTTGEVHHLYLPLTLYTSHFYSV